MCGDVLQLEVKTGLAHIWWQQKFVTPVKYVPYLSQHADALIIRRYTNALILYLGPHTK